MRSKIMKKRASVVFLLLFVLCLMSLTKSAEASQVLPNEYTVIFSENERYGIIVGDDRIMGLLESLERRNVYAVYGGERLTKDNVWIVEEGVSVFVRPQRRSRVQPTLR